MVFSDVLKDESVQVAESPTDSIEEFFIQLIDYKRVEYLVLADESDSEELFQYLVELDSAYTNLKTSYTNLTIK